MAGWELIGWGRHREQGRANETDAGQVCRESVREKQAGEEHRNTGGKQCKQTTKTTENTGKHKEALNTSRLNASKKHSVLQRLVGCKIICMTCKLLKSKSK